MRAHVCLLPVYQTVSQPEHYSCHQNLQTLRRYDLMFKQECIPVGSAPPALYRTGGVSGQEPSVDLYPPGQERAIIQRSPVDRQCF